MKCPHIALMVLGTASAVVCASVVLASPDTYMVSEPDDSTFPCDMCSKGTYWIANCTPPNPQSKCEDCDPGSYQNTTNIARSCAKCRQECSYKRQVMVANCTRTSDLQCKCELGYYLIRDEGFCLRHNACEPGYGVRREGTPVHNTVCEKCKSRHNYSPLASLTQICQPCTVCREGFREKVACTPTNDTVCVATTNHDDNGLSTGKIVCIAGGVVAILLVILAVILCVRYDCTAKLQVIVLDKCHLRPSTDTCKEAYSEVAQGNQGNGVHQNGSHDHCQYNEVNKVTATANNITTNVLPILRDKRLHQKMDTPPVSLATTDNNPSYDSIPLQDIPAVSSDILRELSGDVISHEWQFFIRFLIGSDHHPDELIHEAMLNHPNNVREQIYQLLLVWHKLERPKATLDTIIHALGEIKRQDLVVKYTGYKKCTAV